MRKNSKFIEERNSRIEKEVNMKKYFLINICFASILFISSCSHTSGPVNPCDGKLPFKLDFTIYEQLQWLKVKYEADTVLNGNSIHFEANGNYSSYRWTVGEYPDDIYTKDFIMEFPRQSVYYTFPVRLIATKTADTMCFPGGKTIDTITKHITIYPYYNGSALIGKYRGKTSEDPLDTFDIEISCDSIFDSSGHIQSIKYLIYNFNNGCIIPSPFSGIYDIETAPGYKHLYFIKGPDSYANCDWMMGYAHLSDNHREIIINYYKDFDTTKVYMFNGVKL